KLCQRYEKSESPWLDDLQTAKKIQWNVEIRYFGKDPEKVIEYLGRYINRTAITNNRLISYEDRKVTFTYKDYRDGGKRKEMTLDENEFIRRFCLHILPRRFIKLD
ncbi:transposase, partial [Faecalibaculum rodentium]